MKTEGENRRMKTETKKNLEIANMIDTMIEDWHIRVGFIAAKVGVAPWTVTRWRDGVRPLLVFEERLRRLFQKEKDIREGRRL